MSKIGQWFKRRFLELDLLEEYSPLLFTRWQAALWGGSVLAVAFGWHFVTADWPYPVKVTACIMALFFAGYYVWRADHIRLIPKFQVTECVIKPAIDTEPLTGRRVGRSIWVQLVPECLTEAPVNNCEARLVNVLHRYSPEDKWEHTEMDESVPMGWSLQDYGPVTLRRGVPQRLNIFTLNDREQRFMRPCVNPMSNHAIDVFTRQGQFRFEIELFARDCKPIHVSVEVERGVSSWDKPTINLVKGD
jgi:hypothetical protein